MKKNLFEMGSQFDEGWRADNKDQPSQNISKEIKTPQSHQLHLAKEKRRGKVVTIVKPFYLEKDTLEDLLKTLKKSLQQAEQSKKTVWNFKGISQGCCVHSWRH
ncbi:MAG: SUI1 family translation initiation factor [Sulfurovum sp.]